jgi:two-component system, cell cycle response regulator CpdR
MKKRILIAEDEKTTRDVLTKLATKRGYDVTAVSNGVDLLSVVAVEKFDVVITDLMMADMDGASAAINMKMQGNTTPVVALTGVPAHKMRRVQDSFTRIFNKPVNVRELFEYVESLIGK